MDLIINFFSIDNTFFTLFEYPMSYLEFFGTLFNLACVWLVARNNIWNWPIGILGVILFGVLFYQIQLYSDLIEMGYFLITGFYGWWAWTYYKNKGKDKKEFKITRNKLWHNSVYAGIIIIGTLIMGYLMSNIHLYIPQFFQIPASYPYLDAFTTVLSFTATILMIYKKIESWPIWILVDIIGIGLYYAKGVVFVSLLYFIFLIIASKGLYNWIMIYKSYGKENRPSDREILSTSQRS
jgi:nicotinamide mononucleotide transporter